jgi:hypothetical protein
MEIGGGTITNSIKQLKGKLLSLRERLLLIDSGLSNMMLSMISFFQLLREVLKRLDSSQGDD